MPHESGYHSRGYLPHVKVPGATYFVTFRLVDSLPREVVLRLREQRDDLLRRATQPSREDQRGDELHAWYAREVDAVLDQHAGATWLRNESIASLVASAIRHFENTRYRLHAWCIMPNHVHAVLRPTSTDRLDKILHSWKSFTAIAANRLLGRIGQPFWQRESYDHWIRDDADFTHCCHYTEQNPVKAGLCAKPEEWRWSSAAAK